MENGRRYIQGKTGINVQKREHYKNGPTLGGNPSAHRNESTWNPQAVIVQPIDPIVFDGYLHCMYCDAGDFHTERQLFEHLNSVHLRRRSLS